MAVKASRAVSRSKGKASIHGGTPWTRLACEVVGDDICFPRPILSDSIGSSPASATMEGVNEWNEINSSEATAKVKVMQ